MRFIITKPFFNSFVSVVFDVLCFIFNLLGPIQFLILASLKKKFKITKIGKTLQSVSKDQPCDVIKMRVERRSGKGNPLKRDGYYDRGNMVVNLG